jgi:hypothetical protein
MMKHRKIILVVLGIGAGLFSLCLTLPMIAQYKIEEIPAVAADSAQVNPLHSWRDSTRVIRIGL